MHLCLYIFLLYGHKIRLAGIAFPVLYVHLNRTREIYILVCYIYKKNNMEIMYYIFSAQLSCTNTNGFLISCLKIRI